MEIFSEIKGIKYKPLLCRELTIYPISKIKDAFSERSSFILEINNNQFAISWWVSPKRTRSYPYARIYDTLNFCGKKITIIPIIKDEGFGGDRDFLQWDTISLMSLLNIYVIIGFYIDAEKNPNKNNKITKQEFDIEYLSNEIKKLSCYQSDPLHWNLDQIEKVYDIANIALNKYDEISKKLNIKMHSIESAKTRIEKLYESREKFMNTSREFSKKAQKRESLTIQPKENLSGNKATITIKNYLGGLYYFTCDEVMTHENKLYLIEGKHTKNNVLPSEDDIKDGLIKMILYTNLVNVKINDKEYQKTPVLKLTTDNVFNENILNESKSKLFKLLKEEANINNFKIMINDKFI